MLNVDLDGVVSVNDVLVRINNAVGNRTASWWRTLEGTRLKLVDSSTKVGTNLLTVTALGDSDSAAELGLTVTASSATGADTLNGAVLNSITLDLDRVPQGGGNRRYAGTARPAR